MCVRTHVLFNSYLMYVNHFNIFFIPEVCSVPYTLLYIERRIMQPHGTVYRPGRSYRYASSLIDTAMVLRRR